MGTYLAWVVHNNGWWVKAKSSFTSTVIASSLPSTGPVPKHYFCGSYNFENQEKKEYQTFTTAYSGLAQVIKPDGLYQSQQRFGLYRWHIVDPIRFDSTLRVTIQALGWRGDRP